MLSAPPQNLIWTGHTITVHTIGAGYQMRGLNGLYRCSQIVKDIDDYIYLLIDWFIMCVCFWTSQTNKAWLWYWLLDKRSLDVSKCPAPEKKKIFGVFLWIVCEGVINILRHANLSIKVFFSSIVYVFVCLFPSLDFYYSQKMHQCSRPLQCVISG